MIRSPEDPQCSAALRAVLFGVYLALYAGFVGLCALAPQLLDAAPLRGTPLEGINVALLYGFGLIFAALIVSLLYGMLGGRAEEAVPHRPEREAQQ